MSNTYDSLPDYEPPIALPLRRELLRMESEDNE